MIVRFYVIIWVIVMCAITNSQPVNITSGSFTMGSENGDADELPVHTVSLSAFKMDRAEVTEAQYDACVKSGKCSPAHYTDGKCKAWNNGAFVNVVVPLDRRGPDLPVVCVNWFQAQAYCRANGKQLPSEAQWEYAASAGKNTKYSWGDAAPSSAYCTQSSNQKPDRTCSRVANAFNLCDMTGNVWEWTNDFYARDYYSWSQSQDPSGPEVGLYRVIRGGGWYSNASQLRNQNRNWSIPDFSDVSLGFRCVQK